jgi:hypothetical protein
MRHGAHLDNVASVFVLHRDSLPLHYLSIDPYIRFKQGFIYTAWFQPLSKETTISLLCKGVSLVPSIFEVLEYNIDARLVFAEKFTSIQK